MAQILKYVIGKDYRPLTVLEAKGGNTFTPDYDKSNWVQARQYEDSLRQVFVEITNEDGSAYDLTGANVLFEGILPTTNTRFWITLMLYFMKIQQLVSSVLICQHNLLA